VPARRFADEAPERDITVSRYHPALMDTSVCHDTVDIRATTYAMLSVAALLAVSCGGTQPREVTPTDAGTTATAGPPTLKGSYGVYVTNEISGDLSVIDPATNAAVALLPLGKRPRGIRVAPGGTELYVALSGSPISPPGTDESKLPPPDRGADGIGIVDPKTLALRTILRGPQDPEQTSVSRDGARLYIANEDKGTASVLEIAGGKTIAEFEVGGEPEGVTTSPDGRFVYVTSELNNQVSVIDTAANRVLTRIPVGPRPRDTAFSPDSRRAYVTSENGASVSVVDTATHTVIHTIKLTGNLVRPMGAVVSPDGTRLYVSTGRGGSVIAVNTATNQPIGSVNVGTRPWGLALSPDGARLYTANGPSNDVSVVDTATLSLVAKIPVGQSPWGVAIVER
jgi:YVTN family beta-propeller protein